MRRTLAISGLFVVLVVLSGCVGLFGPGELDRSRLNRNASYEWNHDATVYLELDSSSFSGVYDVTNRSRLAVYSRSGLGRERYLPISALQYRYPNGTVITANSTAISVELTRKRTIIRLPDGANGSVAFTVPRNGKRFSIPVYIHGSYTIRLPANARVGLPVLSQVHPGGYEVTTDGRYTVIRWEQVESETIGVRWYLERDLLLFGGLVVVALVVGIGGSIYLLRQIRRSRRRTEEVGIETDGESGTRRPPPGRP